MFQNAINLALAATTTPPGTSGLSGLSGLSSTSPALLWGGYIAAVIGVAASLYSLWATFLILNDIGNKRTSGELTEFYSRKVFQLVTYRLLFWVAAVLAIISLLISFWSLAAFGAQDWTTWCSIASSICSIVFLVLMREGSIPNLSALTGSTQAPVVVPVGAQPPGSAPVYVQAPVAASEYPQVPVAASEYPQAPAPISEYPQAPAPAPEYSQIPAPAPEYAQAQVPASEYPQAQVPAPVDAQAPGGPTIQVLTEVAPANGPTDRVQKGVDGLLRKDLTKTFGVSEKLSKVAHASNGCCGCGKITTGVAVISIIAVSTFNGVVTSGVASNKVQMASAGITYSSAGGNWCSQYQAVYAQSGYTLSSGCCNALMSDQNQLLSCDNSLSNIGSTDLAQNTNFANCVNQATSIIGNSGVNSNSLDVDLKYSGAVFQCYGLVGYSDCAAFGTVLYNGC